MPQNLFLSTGSDGFWKHWPVAQFWSLLTKFLTSSGARWCLALFSTCIYRTQPFPPHISAEKHLWLVFAGTSTSSQITFSSSPTNSNFDLQHRNNCSSNLRRESLLWSYSHLATVLHIFCCLSPGSTVVSRIFFPHFINATFIKKRFLQLWATENQKMVCAVESETIL